MAEGLRPDEARMRFDPAHFPRTGRATRAKAPTGELPVAQDGWTTCPVCARTWLVVGADDVLLPGCGCYGTDWSEANRYRPCVPCGLKHEQDCPDCALFDTEDDALLPDWAPVTPHHDPERAKQSGDPR